MAAITELTIGAPIKAGHLTVFPIFGAGETLSAACLDEALAEGAVEIREVSAEGRVGEIEICNLGDQPLFLLDGEQVLGLKQNRAFNLSMLIEPGAKTTVPVSCLEQGRWARVPASSTSASHAHFAAGRARKLASVSRSLRERRSYASDQNLVWQDISNRMDALDLSSPTHAEADAFLGIAQRVERIADNIEIADGQIGAAVAVNGLLVGLDIFCSSALFAKLARKLYRSYAAEPAAESRSDDCGKDVTQLLKALCSSPTARFAAPGGGETLRWETHHANAAALAVDGQQVHIAAFPTQGNACAPGCA